MLKHAETTRDKPVITSVQSQAANMPASGWVLRLQLIVCNSEGYRFCMENPRCFSVTFQMRQLNSQE
jgi:hypothetical protein